MAITDRKAIIELLVRWHDECVENQEDNHDYCLAADILSHIIREIEGKIDNGPNV